MTENAHLTNHSGFHSITFALLFVYIKNTIKLEDIVICCSQ